MKSSRLILALAAAAFGCSSDRVAPRYAEAVLTPDPAPGQQALADPPGVDLGAVAIFGLGVAAFLLENDSPVDLRVTSCTVEATSGAAFHVARCPARVGPFGKARLEITCSPLAVGEAAHATVAVQSDAGPAGETTRGRVAAVGAASGTPRLRLCYGGGCWLVPDDCAGPGCTLPALAFGDVLVASTASQTLRLSDQPLAGTCTPGPDAPPCTPLCVVTLAPASGPGFGVRDPASGFGVVGNVPLPFYLGTPAPDCVGESPAVREEVAVQVSFTAADDAGVDAASALVLEPGLPGVPLVEVPLTARTRLGPVAVARLRTCDEQNPPPTCSSADLRPLARAYLDGRGSYDPSRPGDAGALVDFAWSVLEAPVDDDALDLTGQGTPLASIELPTVGTYSLRLTVTNDVGLTSPAATAAVVTLLVLPEQRLEVTLAWDSAVSDLDLHLVSSAQGDRVFSSAADCFWGNCRPDCAPPFCTPVVWDAAAPALGGPNPRLDRDDPQGLGPELVSVDRPGADTYVAYVHDYGLTGLPDVPSQATLRVIVDGKVRAEVTRLLHVNDLWRALTVAWGADGSARVELVQGDVVGEVGAVRHASTMTWPLGTDFGALSP